MANNYLQWSFIVEDLTAAEARWLDTEMLRLDSADFAGLPSLQIDQGNKQAWFYADESGDLEMMTDILVEFLKRHRPQGQIGFTWASTCSKMRPGEFSGGACFITANGTEFMHADTWLESKMNPDKKETTHD